jgi:hypothetical protein
MGNSKVFVWENVMNLDENAVGGAYRLGTFSKGGAVRIKSFTVSNNPEDVQQGVNEYDIWSTDAGVFSNMERNTLGNLHCAFTEKGYDLYYIMDAAHVQSGWWVQVTSGDFVPDGTRVIDQPAMDVLFTAEYSAKYSDEEIAERQKKAA